MRRARTNEPAINTTGWSEDQPTTAKCNAMTNTTLQTSRRRADVARLRRYHDAARDRLLHARTPAGCWEGRLSSSALSTATAVSALSMVSRKRFDGLIRRGVRWLVGDQNPDGGWGDTPGSPTNLPTTMLCQAALYLSGRHAGRRAARCLSRAEYYVTREAGSIPEERASALADLYGKDRTFAVPILANCALAGSDSPCPDAEVPPGMRIGWETIPALPFELACLPQGWFSALRLHVVSYALPALIAIGQLLHRRAAPACPVKRSMRCLALRPALRRLERIQPESGGFLEATPLTSFVVMSLAGAGRAGHAVCRQGVAFLRRSARADGSWPIDTNLSGWLTSLSVEALAADGLGGLDLDRTKKWLLRHQHTRLHPYTNSPPGGWAWTDLSGGVPDADDTAGALVALAHLDGPDTEPAARNGVEWLLGRQNSDGGWPTFCRGWGRLPFDRSAPDLTAHALRALNAWPNVLDGGRVEQARDRGFAYLRSSQRPDGSWVPLWFGNQRAPDHENPVYGTSRVLDAYRELDRHDSPEARAARGYLLRAQNPDGSWGGAPEVEGTMEETALATGALAASGWNEAERRSALDGARYLTGRMEEGGLDDPAPIGLYFARLWYAEDLYPTIWTTAALGRIVRIVEET